MTLHELPTLVIDWRGETLSVQSPAGEDVLPLSQAVQVTMLNLEDQVEEKTLTARDLGDYMRIGYMFTRIAWE